MVELGVVHRRQIYRRQVVAIVFFGAWSEAAQGQQNHAACTPYLVT